MSMRGFCLLGLLLLMVGFSGIRVRLVVRQLNRLMGTMGRSKTKGQFSFAEVTPN